MQRLYVFPLYVLAATLTGWLFADEWLSLIVANLSRVKNIFWAITFGWSTFLALYAFQLHNHLFADDPDDVRKGYGKLRWSQKVHQFVLNFSGSFVGFVIIYLFLYTNRMASLDGWEKIILLLVAFFGTMGYLPYILIVKSWFPSGQ